MSRKLKATILGSGPSTGVPIIGCRCHVCRQARPRNRRTRAGLMITTAQGKHIVFDTGPEFRLQMLRHHVVTLEHVIYTHLHSDHCHGLDDLRAFYFHQKKPVTCHLNANHMEEFKERFAYVFRDTGYHGTKPQIELKAFPKKNKCLDIMDLKVEYDMLHHGNTDTAVFKLGRFAFATDFKAFTKELKRRWRGQIDTMIASGLRYGSHATHSSIEETLTLFDELGVQKGVITHLGHEIDFYRDSKKLPKGVQLAYDGMELMVPYE